MVRFFLRLVLFAPIVLVIGLTNYFVDPANLFYSGNINNDSISYEQTIVNYLSEGFNVTNIDNYDERLFQKLFIESLNHSPEIVVLGSSRSQLIDDAIFKGKDLINNSVTGATIEDFLSIFNIIENKSFYPSKLILEMSPWLFNENNDQTRWKLLEVDCKMMMNKFSSSGKPVMTDKRININPKYYELFSFTYFQESIRYLISKKHSAQVSPFLFSQLEFNNDFSVDSIYAHFNKAGFLYSLLENESKIEFLNRVLKDPDFNIQWNTAFPDFPLLDEVKNLLDETINYAKEVSDNMAEIKEENIIKRNRKLFEATFPEYCPIADEPSIYKTIKRDNTGFTRLTDGTISYPKSFRDRTPDQVNQDAHSYVNAGMFGVENFVRISEEKIEILNSLITYISKRKTDIRFILVPYHPFVYNVIKEDPKYSNILVAEQIIRKIALKKNITIYGSYDPDRLNMKESEFYDGMHIKKESFGKIFN